MALSFFPNQVFLLISILIYDMQPEIDALGELGVLWRGVPDNNDTSDS